MKAAYPGSTLAVVIALAFSAGLRVQSGFESLAARDTEYGWIKDFLIAFVMIILAVILALRLRRKFQNSVEASTISTNERDGPISPI